MLDEHTSKEIDKVVWSTLKDAGLVSPPVRIEDLLAHLELHRDFYSLEDPKLLQHFWHKVKVQGHKLKQVVGKIKLAAVWLPDEERILVDSDLPPPKQEWASFHDSTHRILHWHRGFFLGDTAQTLHPEYQERLETEANYGASALMFCGRVFTKEALQTTPEWSSVEALKRRYGKSWVTCLRRYVEHGHDRPMAMMVSTPLWKKKPTGQVERWRHFVGSRQFHDRFQTVTAVEVLAGIDGNTWKTKGGPVGDFSVMLKDVNGMPHEFRCQSFFNQHDLLTLLVHTQQLLTLTKYSDNSPGLCYCLRHGKSSWSQTRL